MKYQGVIIFKLWPDHVKLWDGSLEGFNVNLENIEDMEEEARSKMKKNQPKETPLLMKRKCVLFLLRSGVEIESFPMERKTSFHFFSRKLKQRLTFFRQIGKNKTPSSDKVLVLFK